MIIICGLAHSHTSVIAKFIKDNGGKFDSFVQGKSVLGWDGYEDPELKEWAENKKRFKSGHFEVRNIIAKYPEVAYFLDDVPEDVKVIFCLRNIEDISSSYYSKYRRGFFQTLNKFSYVYDVISRQENDIYVLMTERILNKNEHEAKRLLDFCELSPDEIIFDFKKKTRKRDYKNYRLFNTIWKILYKIRAI